MMDYAEWADDNAAALAEAGLEEMPDPDEWDGLTDLEMQLMDREVIE